MKKCLLNEKQKTLKSNNKIVKFDYEHYIDACKVMAEEIKKNYNLDEDNIELDPILLVLVRRRDKY